MAYHVRAEWSAHSTTLRTFPYTPFCSRHATLLRGSGANRMVGVQILSVARGRNALVDWMVLSKGPVVIADY